MGDQTPPIENGNTNGKSRQLILVKRGHRYIFRYEPGDEAKVLHELISLAGDPTCHMDWFDAAVLSHQMGQCLGPQIENLMKR